MISFYVPLLINKRHKGHKVKLVRNMGEKFQPELEKNAEWPVWDKNALSIEGKSDSTC